MFGNPFKKNKNPAATTVHLFRSRGDDRMKNCDYNGAVTMYDEALRCAPTDTELLLSRSFAQMMSKPPRLDLALQDADAAIQHRPTHWHGWLQKGETHLRMGDIKAAEEALMNSVGFAQGTDKLTAQRSLADVQSRRDGASSTASPLSVQSTSSTPFSVHSLHTVPRSTSTISSSHTPTAIQTPSATDPTKTTLDSPPMPPSNTQPLRKLNSFSCIKLTCAHWYQPSSRCTVSAPTTPLSDSNTQTSGRPTHFIYSKPTHSNWNGLRSNLSGYR
jgi:hypothetical protein